MAAFLSDDLFDQTVLPWLGHIKAGLASSSTRRILKMVSVVWPGAIDAAVLEETAMSAFSPVSIRFLLDQSSDDFVDYCYALLLERTPDESGRQAFLQRSLATDAEKMSAINSILDSEEYVSKVRPAIVHPDQERLADISFKMRRSTVFYDRQIVHPAFFDTTSSEDEICIAHETHTIISCLEFGRWRMRDKLFFLGKIDERNSFHADAGWIFFGGKFRLGKGSFSLGITISNDDDSGILIDVVSESGTRKHLELNFIRNARIDARFDIDMAVNGLEVRLFKKGLGSSRFHLDSIHLRRV